jgi:hypothetical protein
MTILAVDDSATIRRIIKNQLKQVHRLVSLGGEAATPGEALGDEPGRSDGTSRQDLANEIMLPFQG